MAPPQVTAEDRSRVGELERFTVLAVRVDAVQVGDVVRRLEAWIQHKDAGHYIAVTGMHGVTDGLKVPVPLGVGDRSGNRARGTAERYDHTRGAAG